MIYYDITNVTYISLACITAFNMKSVAALEFSQSEQCTMLSLLSYHILEGPNRQFFLRMACVTLNIIHVSVGSLSDISRGLSGGLLAVQLVIN